MKTYHTNDIAYDLRERERAREEASERKGNMHQVTEVVIGGTTCYVVRVKKRGSR